MFEIEKIKIEESARVEFIKDGYESGTVVSKAPHPDLKKAMDGLAGIVASHLWLKDFASRIRPIEIKKKLKKCVITYQISAQLLTSFPQSIKSPLLVEAGPDPDFISDYLEPHEVSAINTVFLEAQQFIDGKREKEPELFDEDDDMKDEDDF